MSTPRVAILAGLFIAGGLTGAGGTAVLTGAERTVDLVAGEHIVSQQPGSEMGPNGGLAVTIDVYNPEERSVNVEPVAIGGWEVITDLAETITAKGRSWTAISFEVTPDCKGEAAGTLDLATDDAASELALTDEAVTMLTSWRGTYCGAGGMTLEPAVEARSWEGDTFVLDVRVPGHGRPGLGELTIEAVSAGVPYAVEAEGLPATLPVDGSITLTTRWTFDCDPDPAVLADPVGPGGEAPYEAMYLTTPDDIQIHADVSPWLNVAPRGCDDAQ